MSEDRNKQVILTKSTLIPIGLVITICGGVIWLTSIFITANSALDLAQRNADIIAQIQADVNTKNELIIERLARQETKMDLIIDQLNK